MLENSVVCGDCNEKLRDLPPQSVDLIYLDPPFFTNRRHRSSTRDGSCIFSFDDNWSSQDEYASFINDRLEECKRVLKDTGSIYFHGDHNNTHIARNVMDNVFGCDNFRSEIIWYYKRWSNSKRGLLQQHQNILMYSKTVNFKWNQVFTGYSATTNVDQIMQKRSRDERGKAAYATDAKGKVVFSTEKKGVPLGDVWEIPFLNPKAKERTGYPTQKPLLLLEQLISLTTDEGDLVLDPFCGSGTTLVASHLMRRRHIGIDISEEAVQLSKDRLAAPIKTESNLLRFGVESYQTIDPWVEGHLTGIDYSRVQRNGGIDALLKGRLGGKPCFIRVQKKNETMVHAINAIKRAALGKGDVALMVVATSDDMFPVAENSVYLIRSNSLQISALLREVESIPQSEANRLKQNYTDQYPHSPAPRVAIRGFRANRG
jgi:site-specific DNA-methyltransferase (adenine-specific)